MRMVRALLVEIARVMKGQPERTDVREASPLAQPKTLVALEASAARVAASGLGILLGYVKASLSNAPRMQDADYLAFLRRFERSVLIFGKTNTARRYHERRRKAV